MNEPNRTRRAVADVGRAAKALARRYGEEVGFADWLGIARTVASALEPPE
jgi:hypothetical protein